MAFTCSVCEKSYTSKGHLARHQKRCTATIDKPFHCTSCPATYTQKHHLTPSHITAIHTTLPDRLSCSTCSHPFADPNHLHHHQQLHTTPKHHICSSCSRSFIRLDSLRLHQKSCESRRKRPAPIPLPTPSKRQRGGGFAPVRSALRNNATVHRMDYGQERDIFEQLSTSILDDGFTFIQDHPTTKYFFTLKVTFQKAVDPTVITNPAIYFRSEPFINIVGEDVHADLQLAHSQLMHQLDTFERNGSGKFFLICLQNDH